MAAVKEFVDAAAAGLTDPDRLVSCGMAQPGDVAALCAAAGVSYHSILAASSPNHHLISSQVRDGKCVQGTLQPECV